VLTGALAAALGIAGAARAGAPTPFATVSGICSPTAYEPYQFITPPVAGNHDDPIVRITTQGGPGVLKVDDQYLAGDWGLFGGADTLWEFHNGRLPAGEAASGQVECEGAPGAVPYTIDLFDAPTAPTSFSGAATPPPNAASGSNRLAFRAPAAGHYVADLKLSQGAVSLNNEGYPETRSQSFASSGRFDLDSLSTGTHSFYLTPLDGPQARWSLSIHALPVVLSALAFDHPFERPGQIATASYALDGDVTLSATVLNAAGQPVRALAANAPVSLGGHSLTWDGLDRTGSPVAVGWYTLAISYTDAAGNLGAARTSIAVDGAAPTATMISSSRLLRTHGLVIRVADNLSGVMSASLAVDGRKVRTLDSGQTQFTYMPSGGWRTGLHSYSVTARDAAGNVLSRSGSFRVPAPVAPHKATCVRSRFSGFVLRVRPAKCIMASSPRPSFAEAANLTGLRWKSWGGARAVATGYERGFHLPYDHIRVTVVLTRPAFVEELGIYAYKHFRVTSRFGTHSGTISAG
jgi:hypothetical protein